MPPLRRKRSPATNKGLQPGQSLKRFLVPALRSQSSLWAWVGSDVSKEEDITTEHCLMACGLSSRNHFPMCVSKCRASGLRQTSAAQKEHEPDRDDVIIISDDERVTCTKKDCKDNPNCLNYLGQDKWEDEGQCAASTVLSVDVTCLRNVATQRVSCLGSLKQPLLDTIRFKIVENQNFQWDLRYALGITNPLIVIISAN